MADGFKAGIKIEKSWFFSFAFCSFIFAEFFSVILYVAPAFVEFT